MSTPCVVGGIYIYVDPSFPSWHGTTCRATKFRDGGTHGIFTAIKMAPSVGHYKTGDELHFRMTSLRLYNGGFGQWIKERGL